MKAMIPVETGDALAAIQGFLRTLLVQQVVEALLVPMRTPGGSVAPALVTNPELLSAADPLAPIMPGNAAALAGKLSVRAPRAKIGAVLRSCELRALVELTKLQQASMDDMILIAVDCAGTYDVAAYQRAGSNGKLRAWRSLYEDAVSAPDSPDKDLRLACRTCDFPVFEGADIVLELFSSDLDRGIVTSLADELGERLGLSAAGASDRAATVERIVAGHAGLREAEFAAVRARLEGEESIIGLFDACVRCHNCMTMCPVCYCKTCVFKSPVFDHEPMQYMGWAQLKGACRLPADASLFHLTRLNHMVLSCVGCGMCTQACPAELPVDLVFRAIGQRVQEVFEYVPGRSVEEPLPLVTFKEQEWTELGE